jgi:hypothetical protein
MFSVIRSVIVFFPPCVPSEAEAKVEVEVKVKVEDYP